MRLPTDWVERELEWDSEHFTKDGFKIVFSSALATQVNTKSKSEFKEVLFTWWSTQLIHIWCVITALCSDMCWQKGSNFNVTCSQPSGIRGCIVHVFWKGLLWFTAFGGSSGENKCHAFDFIFNFWKWDNLISVLNNYTFPRELWPLHSSFLPFDLYSDVRLVFKQMNLLRCAWLFSFAVAILFLNRRVTSFWVKSAHAPPKKASSLFLPPALSLTRRCPVLSWAHVINF